jgi:hypothetical protein
MGLVHVIGPGEREWFRRCRRAWDFGSPNRRNLEPKTPAALGLARAVRMSMAVWYFPGMWEWPRAIVQPRAMQAFEEAAARSRAPEEAVGSARAMLERYFAWAPTADAFAPVRIESDFEAVVPDHRTPESGVVTPDGRPVRYHDRIHLLIVDPRDTYWIVEHRLAGDRWADRDELLLAERPVSAIWGWEQFYLGMEIAGTVHNELRLDGGAGQGDDDPPVTRPARHPRSRDFARSRAASRAAAGQETATEVGREPEVVVEEGGGWFRRTWIRRSRIEIGAVGERLSAEALDMLDPGLRLYPSPTPEHCGRCDFRAPCLAMNEGADVEAVLDVGYQPHREPGPEEGRLGGGSWSMNRGAAPPPRWRSPPG